MINYLKKENDNLKLANSQTPNLHIGSQIKSVEQGNLGIYNKKRSESKTSTNNNKDQLEGNLDSNNSKYKKDEFNFNPSRQITMNSVGSFTKYSEKDKNKMINNTNKECMDFIDNQKPDSRSNSKTSNAPYEKLMYEEGTININTINDENFTQFNNKNSNNKYNNKHNPNNKEYTTNTVESVSNSKKPFLNLNFNKEDSKLNNNNNNNTSNVVIPMLNFENVGNSKPNYKDKHKLEERNNNNDNTEISNRANESILDEHNQRIKSKLILLHLIFNY